MNARFEFDSKTFMPIREILNCLTVELPKENFKQRIVQRTTDSLVGGEPFTYHIAGYLSGFRLDDQPYYKACPNCHKRFAN